MTSATVALGVGVWWASACRINMMHWATHRASAIVANWLMGAAGLVSSWAAVDVGGVIPLSASCMLMVIVVKTMDDWAFGPPQWALKMVRQTT